MKSQPTFLFLTYFSRIEMAISSKERKANKFGLLSNFVECESSLNQTLLTFLLFKTNLDGSIDSGNFSVSGYLPLI